MEVTNSNFSEALPQIQEAIERCTFMAVDCEFTGLNITRNINALDTPQEYYQKVRRNCKEFLIIQYGLCTFRYDAESNTFKKKDFNFYIFRRPVNKNVPDQRFLCQTSSIHFLVNESFDFNKLFKEGISYLNKEDIEKYKDAVEESYKRRSDLIQSQQNSTNESIPIPENAKGFIDDVIGQLGEFIKSDKDELELPRCNAFYRRLVYQTKSEKFPDNVSIETRQINKDRILFATKFKNKEKEEEAERNKYNKDLKELDDHIGFSKVIKMIINSRKLVVGHNICLDLLHTIDKFLMALPEDYYDFKGMAHDLFPKILDTKYLSSCEPFKDIITSNVLKHLYDTLSQEPFEIPTIEDGVQGYTIGDIKEHEAGFDAYLTGVCFLAMWKYLGAAKKFDDTKTFSNFNLLEPYINRIFVMKLLDNQYINLGGKDLNPPRDHVFHLTFPKEWRANDISQLFSPFGNVYVSWIDETSAYVTLYKKDQAAKALNSLSNAESYKIMTYAKRKALLRGVSTPFSSPTVMKKRKSSEGPPSKRIKLDRSEPCLWQVKSPEYHNRTKKDAAYAKLAQKLVEVEPGADKKSVINKINSLRTAFRKEKKKVDASYKSGTSTDSIYKPVLWYYDMFDFLQDQEISRTSISNLDGESGEESVDNALPTEETGEADDVVEMRTAVVEEVSRKSQQPITSRPGCNKKQKKNEDLTTETLMTVRDHFKTPKEQLDRFDLLGKTIAVKLRGLEKRQALIAEKKIGDILFEAEMGSLNTAPIYRYAASPSQSPYTTPCPTPSPTYGQGSCTALASQSPNVTPCPTPSPTYGQGSFRQFHNDGSGQLSFSQDNTASTYFSQFDANS